MVTTAPSTPTVEQLGNGDDLVRFVRHLDLAEHQALMRRKGRDHVDRRLGVLLGAQRRSVLPSMAITSLGAPVSAATQSRNSAGTARRRRTGCGRDDRAPACHGETAGTGAANRSSSRQSTDIETNVSAPASTARRHSSNTSGERIDHLAGLTPVRQILEIIQENNRLVGRRQLQIRSPIARPPKFKSEDHNKFSNPSLCHELLHPISPDRPGVCPVRS